MNKEEKIDNEFKELIGSLTDEQFWEYTRSWFDEQHICDIMNNWDTETKEEAIKEINNIKNSIIEQISVPIYFYSDNEKIVIDEEGIIKEFNDKLKEIIENPKKFLEI